METKKEITSYIQNASLFLLGLLFFIFPLFIATLTTDIFALPKQAILAGITFLALLLFVAKMIAEKSIRIRRTPFDLPVILFTTALFLSSILAVNKADSLITFVIFLFAVIIYFITVNTIKDNKSLMFLIAALVASGVVLSISSMLLFFKIYILPFSFYQSQTFTPLGSLLEQAIYLGLLLSVAGYVGWSNISSHIPGINQNRRNGIIFLVASIIILIGLFITIYGILTLQRPTILPFETGLQTAFSAISQDLGRVWQGFLFGSGFGTYATDFTRFKQISFNQNQALWTFTFFRSSSFILELLATTGILGLSAFFFLIVRIIKELQDKKGNTISISLVLALIASFILPFSSIIQTLLFILLALFAVLQGLKNRTTNKFFDIELQLVAFKRGLIALETPQDRSDKSKILPLFFSFVIFIIVGVLGYYSLNYLISDITFQKSLIAAANNQAQETYKNQASAIAQFRFRDAYYRIFSQTNLAIANSLASQTPKGSTPSASTQQTISALIQQSINAGRFATTLAPQTTLNWQNLSSIYRSLIGFGQNAENFALVTEQQALNLDPNNPQQYIILGGIYYQIGLWDLAQNQFQAAVNLKPDFANAYYNLGHTLQQKKDIKGALAQYEIVKTLVANNPQSLKQITGEIKELSSSEAQNIPTKAEANNQPLNINKPSALLPSRNPPVKIPAPINPVTATESGR